MGGWETPWPQPLSPQEQAERNRRLTWVLFAVFTVMAGVVVVPVFFLTGSWLALIAIVVLFAACIAAAAAWFHWVLLRAVDARRMATGEWLPFETAVARLCRRLEIPRPQLYVIDDPGDLNALSTGRGREAGALVVTTGLLRLLSDDEAEAVAAHELCHIANGDTELSRWSYALLGWVWVVSWFALAALAAVEAAIGWVAERLSVGGLLGLALWAAYWVLEGLIITAVLAVLFWSLAARLLDLAISRRREFLADATAAQTTKRPLTLASALRRVAEAPSLQRGEALAAKLCIVSPREPRRWWDKLLSSHPPLERRVELLVRMSEAMERGT